MSPSTTPSWLRRSLTFATWALNSATRVSGPASSTAAAGAATTAAATGAGADVAAADALEARADVVGAAAATGAATGATSSFLGAAVFLAAGTLVLVAVLELILYLLSGFFCNLFNALWQQLACQFFATVTVKTGSFDPTNDAFNERKSEIPLWSVTADNST